MRRKGMSIATMALLVTSVGLVACSDDSTGPDESNLLTGLSPVEANDTSSVISPTEPVEPGAFHGNVLGLAQIGGVGDTISNAVKMEGVLIRAYAYSGAVDDRGLPVPGALVGSAQTDANGMFQMPELPGGNYIVTIAPQPPDDATWIGGWTLTTVNAESNRYPWWIFLPRKP